MFDFKVLLKVVTADLAWAGIKEARLLLRELGSRARWAAMSAKAIMTTAKPANIRELAAVAVFKVMRPRTRSDLWIRLLLLEKFSTLGMLLVYGSLAGEEEALEINVTSAADKRIAPAIALFIAERNNPRTAEDATIVRRLLLLIISTADPA